jgi:hypothetical protein
MNEWLTKISSYNILNNLFPGAIFCFIGSNITNYNLIPQDVVSALFFYYFIGMIISRIGSLVVERFLRRTRIVNFVCYNDYIKASRKDTFLKIMSETNNIYRTIISLVLSLVAIKAYSSIEQIYCVYSIIKYIICAVLLLIIFVLAYRKQTNMIRERVNSQISNNE